MTDATPEPTGGESARYVQVALNLPLRREFTYALPDGVTAQPGNRVRVHFHGRKLGGVVTEVTDSTDLPPAKIKPIESLLDGELSLPPALLELARRMREAGVNTPVSGSRLPTYWRSSSSSRTGNSISDHWALTTWMS